MKIRAIVPWFGSKRVLAPRIVEALGPHRAYWEPFCGSMAVLLAKPVCSQETVNDLHGDLVNLGLVIQHPELGPQLYRRLRRTLVHEELHRCSKAVCSTPGIWTPFRTDPMRLEKRDLDRAYWYFIASWLGRNGTIGTHNYNNNFCARYTVNGGIQGTRFASAVDSLPAWRRRMREVTILQKDGFELLGKIEDQAGVAIYCDPPYLRETRCPSGGFNRTSGSATYIHDFESEDHDRLAESLRRFRLARVVVSYYDHPRLAELYPGWSKELIPVAKGMAVQGKRGSKKVEALEVLLVNGLPERVDDLQLFSEDYSD